MKRLMPFFLVFLLVFLFGAALIYWMIYAMAKTVKR